MPPAYLGKLVAGIATVNARMAALIPVYHAVSMDPAGEIYQRSGPTVAESVARSMT